MHVIHILGVLAPWGWGRAWSCATSFLCATSAFPAHKMTVIGMFLCLPLRVDLLAPLMLWRNGFNGVVPEWLPTPSSTAALPAVVCTKVRCRHRKFHLSCGSLLANIIFRLASSSTLFRSTQEVCNLTQLCRHTPLQRCTHHKRHSIRVCSTHSSSAISTAPWGTSPQMARVSQNRNEELLLWDQTLLVVLD